MMVVIGKWNATRTRTDGYGNSLDTGSLYYLHIWALVTLIKVRIATPPVAVLCSLGSYYETVFRVCMDWLDFTFIIIYKQPP